MLLLVAGVAHAQTVSFSALAAPAERLLPMMGKALGLRMEAGPKVAKEVLLVSVKDVPVADLFKRLAQATGAEWEQKDDVYRLNVSGPLDAKEARAERIERGTALLATVRRQAEQRGKQRYSDGQNGVSEAIVGSLSPEFLGGLGFKQRIVFSTRPTPMQRPMMRDMLAGIDLMRMGNHALRNPVNAAPTVTGAPAIVQFAVQIDESERRLDHMLLTADASGRVLRAEMGQIWSNPYSMIEASKGPTLPRPSDVVDVGKEVRERAAALKAGDPYLSGVRGSDSESTEGSPMLLYSTDEVSLPARVRQVPEVLQPESCDPLALFAGPLLEQVAKVQGMNLVADIPDSALRGAGALAAGTAMPTESMVQSLKTQVGMELSADGGWVVARPRWPARARSKRLDRASLGKALRQLAKDGSLSLDARAEYAVAAPLTSGDEAMDPLLFAAVNMDFGKRIATSSGSGERQLLRIYRMLGPGRREAPRPFRTLAPGVRAAITELVFNATMGPSRNVPVTDGAIRSSTWQSGHAGFAPSDLMMERTVFWPNGIPPGAMLQTMDVQEPMIFGLAPNGARPRMSSYSSGYGLNYQEGGRIVASTSHPRLEKYAKGSVLRVSFELMDGDFARFNRVLDSDFIPANAKVTSYEELSDAMRRSIEQSESEIQRMIDENQRAQQQQGGGRKVKP